MAWLSAPLSLSSLRLRLNNLATTSMVLSVFLIRANLRKSTMKTTQKHMKYTIGTTVEYNPTFPKPKKTPEA